eukprot:Gb_38176 [translate_table: standard]
MKKQIDHLSHLLEKNNIGVPDSIKQSSSRQDSSKAKDKKDKGKGKVLVAVASSSSTPSWVIDLGASHHMGSSQVEFSSLQPCSMSSITLGDDTPAIVLGRGSVKVEGEGMRVQFFSDLVEIRMFQSDTTIVVGKADHQSRLYTFSHFAPDTSPKSLDLLRSNHDSDSSDSTPGHSSEDEDSPPGSPTTNPL